jgi:uncharacterized membrane protein (DUF4010 family)
MTSAGVLGSALAAVNSNNGNSIPPGLWFAAAAVFVVVGVVIAVRRGRR